MKKYLAFTGLFVSFVAILNAVDKLDRYSLQYKSCAAEWQNTVYLAKGENYKAAYVQDLLDAQNLIVGGKICPKLLTGHQSDLQNRLDINVLRALRGSKP